MLKHLAIITKTAYQKEVLSIDEKIKEIFIDEYGLGRVLVKLMWQRHEKLQLSFTIWF
jgi:hypothetical protein